MPRPTRFRSSRGCAGARLVRFSCFAGIFDLHEVADLAEHSGERRRLLVLGAAADAAEPERTQGTPMPPGLPDLGASLRDEELGHLAVVLLPAKHPPLWLRLGLCRSFGGGVLGGCLFGGSLLGGSLLDRRGLLNDLRGRSSLFDRRGQPRPPPPPPPPRPGRSTA